MSNSISDLQWFAYNNHIEEFVHFTNERNLLSIFNRGVLSRKVLQENNIPFEYKCSFYRANTGSGDSYQFEKKERQNVEAFEEMFADWDPYHSRWNCRYVRKNSSCREEITNIG